MDNYLKEISIFNVKILLYYYHNYFEWLSIIEKCSKSKWLVVKGRRPRLVESFAKTKQVRVYRLFDIIILYISRE